MESSSTPALSTFNHHSRLSNRLAVSRSLSSRATMQMLKKGQNKLHNAKVEESKIQEWLKTQFENLPQPVQEKLNASA
jgi:arylamine N-acetyltransferase